MAGWGDLGSHTGFRTEPSSGLPCGFSVVGRFMRRARQWACMGVGPIEQWVWA